MGGMCSSVEALPLVFHNLSRLFDLGWPQQFRTSMNARLAYHVRAVKMINAISPLQHTEHICFHRLALQASLSLYQYQTPFMLNISSILLVLLQMHFDAHALLALRIQMPSQLFKCVSESQQVVERRVAAANGDIDLYLQLVLLSLLWRCRGADCAN